MKNVVSCWLTLGLRQSRLEISCCFTVSFLQWLWHSQTWHALYQAWRGTGKSAWVFLSTYQRRRKQSIYSIRQNWTRPYPDLELLIHEMQGLGQPEAFFTSVLVLAAWSIVSRYKTHPTLGELMLFNYDAGEDSWESWESKIKPINSKGNHPWIFIGRTHAEAEAPILWPTWCKEPTHRKRSSCWERLKAEAGDDRGQDGWMASLPQWTRIWANSQR